MARNIAAADGRYATEFGAHLPLADLGAGFSLSGLKTYARAADALGYRYLCANDHLVFARPWLDGPTALAAVLEESGQMTLATTVSLPVVRGPAVLAKTLTALDVLSDGRLMVVAGPGSSPLDYAAVGVPLEQRWARFDEAVPALRALLRGQSGPPDGRFYALADVRLAPARPNGVPVWVASWGSPPGLRRVRRDGDGWLASAYNTSAAHFASCVDVLGDVPNALGTAWMYVTDDARQADAMIGDVLAPMLNRDADELRAATLPIGPAALCAERISDYARAGAQRIFLWPLADHIAQLERFMADVAPLVSGQ
jgi:alkanesulfonate monooxygenase SsuD/methylene tetrahydromethanopterin reductase-like flavin-dependent oxidoreductase (luciferase family)